MHILRVAQFYAELPKKWTACLSRYISARIVFTTLTFGEEETRKIAAMNIMREMPQFEIA